MEKTIAAISTANGVGGMGVIRISGEKAGQTAEKVFRSVSGKKVTEMKGYTASFGKIYDGDELIVPEKTTTVRVQGEVMYS